MTIAATSISKDGTVGITGGVATAFKSLGSTEKAHNVYFDGVDTLTRSSAEFTISEPRVKPDAPNGYTQKRNKVVLRVPLMLDNGNRTINTFEIKMSVDIETTTAELDTLRSLAAQLITDVDLDEYWNGQSVA